MSETPTPAPMEIAGYLNEFPEVTWDRWAGDGVEHASVFGWVPREDGRQDFVLILLDGDGPWYINTSSAKYSAEFADRLFGSNPNRGGHGECKRVEHSFPGVKAVQLEQAEKWQDWRDFEGTAIKKGDWITNTEGRDLEVIDQTPGAMLRLKASDGKFMPEWLLSPGEVRKCLRNPILSPNTETSREAGK
jgi:hypothetical protein